MDAGTKTNPGNFFEDFTLGQRIEHATPRTVTVGAPADLCLLASPLRDVLASPGRDQVAATLVAGDVIHLAARLG